MFADQENVAAGRGDETKLAVPVAELLSGSGLELRDVQAGYELQRPFAQRATGPEIQAAGLRAG
jgi:hypothetical protein